MGDRFGRDRRADYLIYFYDSYTFSNRVFNHAKVVQNVMRKLAAIDFNTKCIDINRSFYFYLGDDDYHYDKFILQYGPDTSYEA